MIVSARRPSSGPASQLQYRSQTTPFSNPWHTAALFPASGEARWLGRKAAHPPPTYSHTSKECVQCRVLRLRTLAVGGKLARLLATAVVRIRYDIKSNSRKTELQEFDGFESGGRPKMADATGPDAKRAKTVRLTALYSPPPTAIPMPKIPALLVNGGTHGQ